MLIGGVDVTFGQQRLGMQECAVATLVMMEMDDGLLEQYERLIQATLLSATPSQQSCPPLPPPPPLRLVHTEHLDIPDTSTYALPPYRPGYLGLREVPLYRDLLANLAPASLKPHVLLVDGCGLLHPRRCGAATMLGREVDMPTIGVAKSLLCWDADEDETGMGPTWNEKLVRARLASTKPRNQVALEYLSIGHEVLGVALAGHAGSMRPMYISVGHQVASLDRAISLVLATSIHRIPEPIRLADHASRERIKAICNSS